MTLSIRPILEKLPAGLAVAFILLLAVSAGASIDDFEVREHRVLVGGERLALHDGVDTIEVCAARCEGHPSCTSFYYRPDLGHCAIERGGELSSHEFRGHVSAVSRPIRRYVTAAERGASGTPVSTRYATSPGECAQLCDRHGDECRSFTFAPHVTSCWMYDGTYFTPGSDPSWTAGIKREHTHRVVPVYVVPAGATQRANYAEALEEVMSQVREYFLWALGSTFEYDPAEIMFSDRPAGDFTDWQAGGVADALNDRFADGYYLEKNTYVFVIEGAVGGAWGGYRNAMMGGFWREVADTYPGDISGMLAAWPHELGHAFGLHHTLDTKACLLDQGVDMGELPNLIMQQLVASPTLYGFAIADEEKDLLLDPGYHPDCRLGGRGDPHSVAILDPTDIPPADCGDGIVSGPEQCDDGNLRSADGCDSYCRLEPACGDGTLDEGEQCDDGNVSDDDGCDAFCQLEEIQLCGDGIVDAGEQCDDGNTVPGDGCDAFCQIEEVQLCGNGLVDAGEQCDDGNTMSGDGCDATCQIEIKSFCGDGIVDAGEQCDDGNTRDGDGCSALCEIEPEEELGDPLRGKKLKIRDGDATSAELSRLKIVLVDSVPLAEPETAGDPRCPRDGGFGGARLSVTGTSGASFSQELPCEGWRVIGRKGFTGYKYVDATGVNGACSRVVLKHGKVKVKCAGAAMDFDLVPGVSVSEVDVKLELGEATTLCAAFQPADSRQDGSDGERLKAGPSSAPVTCSE